MLELKRDSEGNISRHKARLVAQGFVQRHDIDNDKVRYSSIRVLLALANALELEVHQMDVQTVLLNGTVKEKIYMEQPRGFEDVKRPDAVCFLHRSQYGWSSRRTAGINHLMATWNSRCMCSVM